MKIFVTIGSMKPFDRLISEIDLIGTKHEIFAQIGESELKPKNIKWKKMLNQTEFKQKIKWADIVICHGAIVTITQALSNNKQVIIVPRQKKFGEAIDDHQLEIAPLLEKKYDIKSITNIKNIEKYLKKSNKKIIKPNVSKELVEEIKKLIDI
ncbi:MAG: glycosyltransferase [Candidatus ainarchaeum sp.]|nr:glycosyltransferase [Candidatus ainarchaeum sp.]